MAAPSVRHVGFLLALKISKCDHIVEEKKEFITVSSQQTIGDVFDKYHPSLDADINMKKGQMYETTSWCTIGLGSTEKFKVCFHFQGGLPVY